MFGTERAVTRLSGFKFPPHELIRVLPGITIRILGLDPWWSSRLPAAEITTRSRMNFVVYMRSSRRASLHSRSEVVGGGAEGTSHCSHIDPNHKLLSNGYVVLSGVSSKKHGPVRG